MLLRGQILIRFTKVIMVIQMLWIQMLYFQALHLLKKTLFTLT